MTHRRQFGKPTSRPPRVPPAEKPKLDMYHVPVFRVHYRKLEAYITKVYGFDFDFLLATGLREGECPEYKVDGELPSTEWERRAGDLRAGRRTKSVTLILNVLAKDGYIPRGHYTVSTHELPDPVVAYTQLLQRTRDPQSPDCLAFKERNKTDRNFMEKAAILDKAQNERNQG